MKKLILLAPLFVLGLTGCEIQNKIQQTTYSINENTCAIENSTAAIHRNLETLEKMQ